jgi:hypothetical protein
MLRELTEDSAPKSRGIVEEKYEWFLEKTGLPEARLLEFFKSTDNRRIAFENADLFGKALAAYPSGSGATICSDGLGGDMVEH